MRIRGFASPVHPGQDREHCAEMLQRSNSYCAQIDVCRCRLWWCCSYLFVHVRFTGAGSVLVVLQLGSGCVFFLASLAAVQRLTGISYSTSR